MVRYADDSVVPVSRERLWRLLELHARDDRIREIHPDLVSQETESEGPGEYVVKRGVKVLRHLATARWKVTYRAPDRFRWEILDGSGPWTAGSYLASEYSETAGGTRIVTEGELTIVGLPGFLQTTLIRSAMNRIDAQDLAFLARTP